MDETSLPTDAPSAIPLPGPESTAQADTPVLLESEGRNGVFKNLVKGDDDITGLVAYSVFKQNELDWLTEFRKAKGRDPTDAEVDAYIIGESTTRRLATYRHLADATLAGRGPEVVGTPKNGRSIALRSEPVAGRSVGGGGSVLAYVAIAIVILIGVYLAVRAFPMK